MMKRRLALTGAGFAMVMAAAAAPALAVNPTYHHAAACNEKDFGESGGIHRSEFRLTNTDSNPADPFGARRVLCPVPKTNSSIESGTVMAVRVNVDDNDANDNVSITFSRRDRWGELLEFHTVGTLGDIGRVEVPAFVDFVATSFYMLEVSLTPNSGTDFMRLHSYITARCPSGTPTCA